MSNKIIEEANRIVPALQDKENIVEVQDPFFSLKSTLFSFFENMLLKVQAEDHFMKTVKGAILEKIETGDISVTQLMSLLNSLNTDKLSLVDSMLSIFKPAPGTGEVSPLINPNIKNSDGEATAFDNLSANQREILDKLQRIVTESEIATEINE